MAEGDTAAGTVKFKKLGLKRLPPEGPAAGFPDPAEAPTMGLLWAKQRQQRHFRLHAPIAGQ